MSDWAGRLGAMPERWGRAPRMREVSQSFRGTRADARAGHPMRSDIAFQTLSIGRSAAHEPDTPLHRAKQTTTRRCERPL